MSGAMRSSPDDVAPEVRENDFCAGCGMCCDGTLFDRAPVARGEEARIEANGLQLFDHGGNQNFRLPCAALKDGRCSIYKNRFQVCRDYRCKLLKRHNLGELEPGEGRRRVAEAKELLSAVIACDPDGALNDRRQSMWRTLSKAVAKAKGSEKEELAGRLLAVAAFETYIRNWFRSQPG